MHSAAGKSTPARTDRGKDIGRNGAAGKIPSIARKASTLLYAKPQKCFVWNWSQFLKISPPATRFSKIYLTDITICNINITFCNMEQ
jgi:hypothetical protein